MKILAFSDLHRDLRRTKELLDQSQHVDAVIAAGDFATFGQGADDVLEVLDKSYAPVLIVAGNYDTPRELEEMATRSEVLHYLHGTGITIKGVAFFGAGGEVPLVNPAPWNFGVSEEDTADVLAGCPANGVLITHSPPLGVADQQSDGRHVGSSTILQVIKAKTPVLALCGHIHDAWGVSGRVGSTEVHNLGTWGKQFTL